MFYALPTKLDEMRFSKSSRGVSPIIATLLLVAITIALGVIAYVYVNGVSGNLTNGSGGQQTSQQLELTAYSFSTLSGSCSGNTSLVAPCLTISLKNAGGSAVTIDGIYFNGAPLSTAVQTGSFSPITLATHGDATIQLAASGTFSSNEGYTGLPSSSGITGGSGYPLKIVTTTGGLFSYTVTAGSSQ